MSVPVSETVRTALSCSARSRTPDRPNSSGDRCYLDDVPGAPLPEVWERSFGHDDNAKEIRLDLSPKLGERGVFHGAYIAIARPVEAKPCPQATLISSARLGGVQHRYSWHRAA